MKAQIEEQRRKRIEANILHNMTSTFLAGAVRELLELIISNFSTNYRMLVTFATVCKISNGFAKELLPSCISSPSFFNEKFTIHINRIPCGSMALPVTPRTSIETILQSIIEQLYTPSSKSKPLKPSQLSLYYKMQTLHDQKLVFDYPQISENSELTVSLKLMGD